MFSGRRVSIVMCACVRFVAISLDIGHNNAVAAFAPNCHVSARVGWNQRQGFANSLLTSATSTATSTATGSSLYLSASSLISSTPSITQVHVNTIGVAAAVLLLSSYHINLYRKEKLGQPTWRSTQAGTREAWSRYVRSEEAWLYAIQTLRNAITAQTFLATTVLSLLTVISGRLWKIQSSTTQTTTSTIQFALVAAMMLSSAYQFLQSARLMTHAGFMFPVTKNTTEVDRIMRRSQHSQWMGLRCLYIAAGLLSWIVGGPKVFCFASVLLTIFFRKIDQVPVGIDV